MSLLRKFSDLFVFDSRKIFKHMICLINMDLILLSGNSKMTKEWIESVEEKLKGFFANTHIQYYDHWENGKEIIDLEKELSKLHKYTKSKKEYLIFAKSAGVALTLKGVAEKKIFPKKCLFLGIPVNWCKQVNFPIEKWMENFNIPSIFIQKSQDPAISADELKNLIEKNNVKSYDLVNIPGNDHHYEDLNQIKKQMEKLIE